MREKMRNLIPKHIEKIHKSKKKFCLNCFYFRICKNNNPVKNNKDYRRLLVHCIHPVVRKKFYKDRLTINSLLTIMKNKNCGRYNCQYFEGDFREDGKEI
jgi:hypothetical protein